MSETERAWVLTDTPARTYVNRLRLSSEELGLPSTVSWCVEKRRLVGGLSDNVDIVTLAFGDWQVTVCPTRGMGLWKGRYRDIDLGWKAPVQGPVHPMFVNRDELGGIGWLQGFDEWIVRCGLNNNGAPATDRLLDNTGAEQTMALPLHGRIANIPAHHVSLLAELTPPYTLKLIGMVDESMLFFPQLRLTTEISLTLDGPLIIHDRVTNLRSQPAEFELLYHCNFGPPLLEEGSRLHVPIRRLAPINAHSARSLDTWDRYPPPTAGVIEECFLMQPLAGADGQTLAVLANAAGTQACGVRFSTTQLPYFTLWKNPAALSDGYVTGLEPGTDFPNAKPFERQHGRVLSLPPGGSHQASLTIHAADTKSDVDRLIAQVDAIQKGTTSVIHREPPSDWAG
jgi:galactose mutarotase-like enzyme